MKDLCGNTWCIHNDKGCTCLVNKGVDYRSLEEVEKTGNKKLINEAYGNNKKCYKKDTAYVKSLHM